MNLQRSDLSGTRLTFLRVAAASALTLLGVQFLLGILTNLYVSLPHRSFGGIFAMSAMMPAMRSATGVGRPLLMAHMMTGPLLVVVALAVVVAAVGTGRVFNIVLSVIALGAVLLAGYSGMAFLMGGGNSIQSFLMASGFLVAFSAYFGELLPAR